MQDTFEDYRLRAEELRTIAETMRDQEAAAAIRRLAAQHEATAERLEAQARSGKSDD